MTSLLIDALGAQETRAQSNFHAKFPDIRQPQVSTITSNTLLLYLMLCVLCTVCFVCMEVQCMSNVQHLCMCVCEQMCVE